MGLSRLPSLFYIASLAFLVARWLASKGLLKEAERSVARTHRIKQQDLQQETSLYKTLSAKLLIKSKGNVVFRQDGSVASILRIKRCIGRC